MHWAVKEKRNILTCQEFPSAKLKEKGKTKRDKEVRVQFGLKEKQNMSIYDKFYTTEE